MPVPATPTKGTPPIASNTNEPAPPAQRTLRFCDLIASLAADADARHAAKEAGKPFGALSGLPTLDARLGGALAPGLHILHGSPGVGKTAFALQAAASCKCPCLFVTCEMGLLELLRRHTARATKTYLGKFKTGELPGAHVVSLARRAASEAPLLALLDATETPAPQETLLTAAEATRRLDPENPHLLLVVDSLHSWADGLGVAGDAEYDRLNEALADLRFLSKRLDVPILAVAERNRGAMKLGGQSAGAGTRKIEYGAETVLELQADEKAQADADGELDVELRISKNRNGAAGKAIPLRFNGGFQRYKEDAQ